jgi:hypothetical protein
MLLINFVELRVVAGRSRTRAGRPHAFSGRPMLIHTCHAHAAPMPRCAMASRSRFQNDMVVALARHGMCESNTAALCKSNWKAQSKPLGARHGRGTAWQGNGMVCVNLPLQTELGNLWSAPGTLGCCLWFRYALYMARTVPGIIMNLVNRLRLGITKWIPHDRFTTFRPRTKTNSDHNGEAIRL